MAETLRPDICVIGAGSGGLSVAAAAAAFGVPVVLIEKGRMGGDCLNTGCVPSKALIASARRAHAARTGAALGATADAVKVDFDAVHAHVHGVIGSIAPMDSAERFTGLGVRVIKAGARFTDKTTVVAGEYEIKARRFVVATGSSPAIPPIEGLDAVPFQTNEEIFELTQCPRHLIVIGGGPIGLELGQAFRRLGSDVTVIEAATPLAKEDPECAAIVLDQLLREGVALRSGAKVVRVSGEAGRISVALEGAGGEETVEGTHLLVAAGRRASVDGLDLEKAGIEYDRRGIQVDKRLRTTNKRIYAIGDVAGGLQFTHAANYHAGLVIRNALFRLPVAVNDALVPRVTYTDPELGHIGLTEIEARERHKSIRVMRASFHDNDRATAEGERRGHVKIVTNKGGKILGATIVGPEAGDLIAPWSLALSQGMNIRAMAGVVLPYPTRGEAGKRAAIEFFAPGLRSPWLRRFLGFLRMFG
jgi:pyruvate/2-oxoglutarate dehydrogenase complex dihydrolipoamide dehydrogenase (E3) component